MTAITLAGFGGPEMLTPAVVSAPRPKAGEVLIKVAAAGVNRPDVVQREGRYPPPPGASEILGLEIAGNVIACGPGAAGFREETPSAPWLPAEVTRNIATRPRARCSPCPMAST